MLTFGIIGDYGVYSRNSRKIAGFVKSWGPDAIFTTGDNLYSLPPTAENYSSIVGLLYKGYINNSSPKINNDNNNNNGSNQEIRIINQSHTPIPTHTNFFPTIGNHDYPYHGYSSYFGLPTYYAVEFGQDLIKCICLNNYKESYGSFDFPHSSRQRSWLEIQLQTSAHFKWILVYFHYPLLCSNNDDDNGVASLENGFPFHKYPNIVLILSGHQHIYERLNWNGIQHVIVGTSGHSIRKISKKPEHVLAESAVIDDSGYGALRLKVNYEGIKGEYFVVGKNGDDKEGLIDSFDITSNST